MTKEVRKRREPKTHQINVRLSEITLRQLRELEERWGETAGVVVRRAIALAYDQEKKRS